VSIHEEINQLEQDIYAEIERVQAMQRADDEAAKARQIEWAEQDRLVYRFETKPEPVQESIRVVRISPTRVLRTLIPVLMLLLFVVIGTSAVQAKADTDYPCTGDGMSKSCTNCIVNTPIGQGQCMSDIAMYDVSGNPLERRRAALAAKGTLMHGGTIQHNDGEWPVTQGQYNKAQYGWEESEAQKKEAEPGPATAPANPYDPNTPAQDSVETTAYDPLALEGGGGMDARTMWAIAIVSALGITLAFKRFAPAQFAAGQGKVVAMNSTVQPHARDFAKGMRKFAPGLVWLFRFETGWGFVAKMVILLLGVFFVFSVLFGFLGFWLSVLFVIAVVFGLGRLDTAKTVAAKVETGRWWEPKQFTNALIAAGIVSKGRVGDPAPTSLPAGEPVSNQFGTEAKFDLPGALTADMVNKKKGSLAKALRVPLDRLLIDQGRTDPEGTVTVWIGSGLGEKTLRASVPTPGSHDATKPFVVGRTVKGVPVTIATKNRQTLLAGQPGQGKTFLARRMLLHWLADPMGKVFVIDAKGDNDYVNGAEFFTAYVTTASGNKVMLANVEKVLTHVFGIMNDHNARRRINESPVLVVLEEWWSVLATAEQEDKALRKRIDYLMQEVTKKGRAANIHVLLVSQEMRDESISAKVRAMFQQAMAFALASPGEQRMVFGSPLTVRPAVEVGEVNLKVNGVQAWVKADLLDEDDWVTAVNEMTPRDPLTLTEVKPLDPLTLAVMEALTEQDGLEPQALFDMLPEDLRTGTPATLGKALGAKGIKSEPSGGRRVYRLAAVQAAVQEG
jgi:hypothetical protein